MALTRLTLRQFRNHAATRIDGTARFNVLVGENGAGKTNVLEAISLLAPGRGLRRAQPSEMAAHTGDGSFALTAALEDGALAIATATTPQAPGRRSVRINGADGPATRLAEWLALTWLTPAMDRLFSEAASGRRRFLDRLVLALAPHHAMHSARYEAAMRARNKLLADDGPPDAAWLSALEARMAEHGAAIAAARIEAVAALTQRLALAPEGPFARAGLRLEGWTEGDLASELAQGRARDAAAGRTLAGPHRTDLVVTHLGKNQPAELCSTGEQKALLLGLILAHADLVAERAGRRPILLLDEVAAHLDPSRRAALFERLASAGGQVWMTGTESALFDAVGTSATRLNVAGGHIEPM